MAQSLHRGPGAGEGGSSAGAQCSQEGPWCPVPDSEVPLGPQFSGYSRDDSTSLFYFYIFLEPRHMEVPRLGVKSELHLPAYTTATQHGI